MSDQRKIRFRDGNGRELPADPFDPFRLLVIGTTVVWRASKALTDAIDAMDNMVRAHANWRTTQREFAQAALYDIERMVEPVNPPPRDT